MQLKPITAIIVLLLVVASLSVAGCTVSPATSSPTPTPNSDYSATFAKIMEQTTWTPINKISKFSENVYSGSYKSKPDKNGSSNTYDVRIEVVKSETEAKERYGQLILQKQDDGYSTYSGVSDSTGPTIYGDAKEAWTGYKLNSLVSASLFDVLYAYNTEIGKWIVVTHSGDTFSQHI